MGALTSTLTSTLTGVAANAVSSRVSDNIAAEQLREQQAFEEKMLKRENKLRKERINVETAQAEDDRRDALRRVIARQRAQFGASGISASGGSSEAVLLGLYNESEEEAAQREEIDNLKKAALDEDLAQTKSLNLLQRNQLEERQRATSALSVFGDLF